MYKAVMTPSATDNFRPWNTRLGAVAHRHRRHLHGLGVYTPGEYVVPTTSDTVFQRQDYPFMDPALSFKPGTQSVNNLKMQLAPAPAPGAAAPQGVTGLGRLYRSSGLGLDLSSLTSSPIFWLAAAAGAYYFLVMRKR
jgi:hypothetical protein